MIRSCYKCYVVLYTCTGAKVFINSYSRFISRRGCPVRDISDNGSVFTPGETQAFVISPYIEWKFNLEKVPLQGVFF